MPYIMVVYISVINNDGFSSANIFQFFVMRRLLRGERSIIECTRRNFACHADGEKRRYVASCLGASGGDWWDDFFFLLCNCDLKMWIASPSFCAEENRCREKFIENNCAKIVLPQPQLNRLSVTCGLRLLFSFWRYVGGQTLRSKFFVWGTHSTSWRKNHSEIGRVDPKYVLK